MSFKDALFFDPSVLDNDDVGAYLRSGDAGALITHRGAIKSSSGTFDFVDGDVTVGSDQIAETAHGFNTGDKVQLTSTGTLPAGLALATDYYVIRVDADNLKLAASPKDAEQGTAVDITAAAGGGTHTVTGQEQDVRALDVWINNPVISIDDNGSTISIDDGGSSITVDGSVGITGDVNVTQGTSPWVVSATDLDIRDLSHSQDSVKIGDGTDFLAVNADGSINVQGSFTTTEEDVYAEDSAFTEGDKGTHLLAVRQDSLAVSTSTDGDYGSVKATNKGEIYVKASDSDALLTTIDADTGAILSDTNAMVVDLAAIEVELLDQGTSLDTIAGDTTSMDSILTALSKAEDSVHSSGDQGIMSLAVRNDSGSPLAADGDYIPFTTDSTGALRVTLDGDDEALGNTAFTASQTDVDNTAGGTQLISSALSNRKYLLIQNLGSERAYIGANGVTEATGFRLSPGSVLELRAGASLSFYAITSSAAGADMRMLEIS